MDISITFRHLEATEALRNYAQEKVAKIKKYIRNPTDASVILSLEKHRHMAEITINVNRTTINAKEVTEDMYAAIDLAMDKIERQVKKYREKIKDHKQDNTLQNKRIRYNVVSSESFEKNRKTKIIKTESIFIKPMSLDEAIMQMDLVQRDFLVFTNAATQKVNVLYRRDDGDYGLIEQEGT
jgi:putative sigma-54 modulation protein